MQKECIVLIPSHREKTYLNKMLCKLSKPFLFQQCDGLQTDPIGLWMLTAMDSMEARQPGLQENTVDIECYLPTSWKS